MAQRQFAQFGGLRDRESAEQASPVFTTGLGDPKEIRRSKKTGCGSSGVAQPCFAFRYTIWKQDC
jgi:hypothetical protein